ncbi:helix-turn-helix domain-containing protein [Streptomyces avicenniae]|uniref:helix-turn-helix domain-containing protein n=1 Tax=Streptomyces avicenniae TaxID=500153 RepID=UPI001CBA6A14|nr:helix-turn-helix transcriptional regulator [Streptomyces avicenniae]
MSRPKELNPYMSSRAFYGAELRRLREAAGLAQDDLGAKVFCSGTYIGQFETAARRPQLDISKMLDEIFGTDRHLQRLCQLANESGPHPDYFAETAELEEQAEIICEFSPMLVPGLLQIEEYARTLMLAGLPFEPTSRIEQLVSTRLGRQEILERSTPPVLSVVVHEAALRIPVSGPGVMATQLEHLLDAALFRQRVEVQVVPFSEGPLPFMNEYVKCMSFTDAPPVTYTETTYTGHLIDAPQLVTKFERSYDRVRAAALPPKASRQLIESVMKDYRSS